MSKVDDEIERDIRRAQREIENRCSSELMEMVDWNSVCDAMEHGCLVGSSIVRWIVERDGMKWERMSEKDRKELLMKVLKVYTENRMSLAIVSEKDAVSTVVIRKEE
jgi:hypothetical protein